jgi:hypothetical protein
MVIVVFITYIINYLFSYINELCYFELQSLPEERQAHLLFLHLVLQ